jgi:NADH:ubiquinone oxidoreductase subunit F (NADH-binding)
MSHGTIERDPQLARPTTQRLLGSPPDLPLPYLDADQLISLVEEAGLTGRGGAGFPTARKLRAVAGHEPVVVGNAMEGEPLSSKDAVLLERAPGLVVDGLSLLASSLGARRAVLVTGPTVRSAPAEAAARGTRVEVIAVTDASVGTGFVAGQESALVARLNGRRGIPSDSLVPVWRRGVDGRPTLVLNAETLAQLALLARHGAPWFRSLGTPDDPGTFLATVTGSSPGLVTSPGVLEAPRGIPLLSLLGRAGTAPEQIGAVLVGGYHGAWVPSSALDVLTTRSDLDRFGASPGAGVVHALDRDACPLEVSARIATYLAGESARQCGPCVNGLPRMAQTLTELSRPETAAGTVEEVERLRRLIDGRGACAHPAGTLRFVSSTMTIFRDHVAQHLGGECRARARRLDSL